MKRKAAVLFDVDGVLVQTEALRAKAHAATVRSFGGKLPISFYLKIGGAGKSHEEVRTAFIEQSGISVAPDAYTRTFRAIFKRLLKGITPTLGIPELLKQLKDKGCLLGAVSSSETAEVEEILKRASLAEYFDLIVFGDQAAHKKPAPDLYLLALSRLSLNPASVIAIEDSDSGVKAALGAGLEVIAFRHRYNRSHSFAGAKNIFDSFRNTEKLTRLILANRRRR